MLLVLSYQCCFIGRTSLKASSGHRLPLIQDTTHNKFLTTSSHSRLPPHPHPHPHPRGAEMVGETAKRQKGAPFLALLLMMLMIFLHYTPCGATTSIFEPSSTSPYLARMDEPDWMFDSEISRMLISKLRTRSLPALATQTRLPFSVADLRTDPPINAASKR
jgi:hypothetical protein